MTSTRTSWHTLLYYGDILQATVLVSLCSWPLEPMERIWEVHKKLWAGLTPDEGMYCKYKDATLIYLYNPGKSVWIVKVDGQDMQLVFGGVALLSDVWVNTSHFAALMQICCRRVNITVRLLDPVIVDDLCCFETYGCTYESICNQLKTVTVINLAICASVSIRSASFIFLWQLVQNISTTLSWSGNEKQWHCPVWQSSHGSTGCTYSQAGLYYLHLFVACWPSVI